MGSAPLRPSDEAPAPQRRSCPACLHHSPRRARPCRLGPQAAVCCAAAVRPAPWSVRASPSCAAPHPASRRQRTPPTLTLASVCPQKGRAGRTPQSRLVPASMAAPSARQVASLAPCKPPRLPLLRGLRGTFGPAAGVESRDGVCPRPLGESEPDRKTTSQRDCLIFNRRAEHFARSAVFLEGEFPPAQVGTGGSITKPLVRGVTAAA